MKRLKCTIQYDGTFFSGFQVQPQKRTVQSEIEAVLHKMHKTTSIRVTPSGRTDAGVHAMGQVIHFDSNLNLAENAWKRAFSSLLPNDIYVLSVEQVSDNFHARYDVKQKEYRYRILNQAEPNIFQRNYVGHVREPLDLDAMKLACAKLQGTHDFTSFSSARSTVKGDKIRTLYEVDCYQKENEIVVKVVGSGFLYNMVRIITGTLIEVGLHRLEPTKIKAILEGKDRELAGKTAPSQGLYLWGVSYDVM